LPRFESAKRHEVLLHVAVALPAVRAAQGAHRERDTGGSEPLWNDPEV